jgi:hypothetical protein
MDGKGDNKKQSPHGKGTQAKHDKATEAKSPGRARNMGNRRGAKEVKDAAPRAQGWYCNGCLLDGNLALVTLSDRNPGKDAYSKPLENEIGNKESTDPISQIGLIGPYNRRINLHDPRPLKNSHNDYTRKAYIVLMEPEEMTEEGLLAKVEHVKRFQETKKANTFGTKVFIPSDWNLTPPEPAELPKLDHWLVYKDIVQLIRRLYAGAGNNWYQNNRDEADAYFSEGFIPFDASTDLGFPEHKCLPAPPVPEYLLNVGVPLATQPDVVPVAVESSSTTQPVQVENENDGSNEKHAQDKDEKGANEE